MLSMYVHCFWQLDISVTNTHPQICSIIGEVEECYIY